MSDRINEDDDRRNFYRLEDRVYVEYRHLSKSEVKAMLTENNRYVPKDDDFDLALEIYNQQLRATSIGMRSEIPEAVQYLETLNRKVDLLVGMLAFERFRSAANGIDNVATSTYDISEGGISFNAPEPLAKGSYLLLKMVIMGAKLGIETIGKVVRSRVEKLDKNEMHRVGVEFPYILEMERRSLTKYIFDRQREQIRTRIKK